MISPVFSVNTLDFKQNDTWRLEYFEFLQENIEEIESNVAIEKLEDITTAIFSNKSEILGKLALALVKKHFGELLEQNEHQCPLCGRCLKVREEKVKREIETMAGRIELYRPYFYCKHCNKGYYPLDDALQLAEGRKQYDVQDLEAWLSSELPYETASEAFTRCTGEVSSAHHMHTATNQIVDEIDVLDVCPTKEEIEAQIDEFAKGQFRRPVVMIAVDGAHVPVRPEPSPHKGKRGKGEWKEAKGFRVYLIDSWKIHHLISWHQVQTDEELGEALKAIRDAGLIPEDKVRLCVIGDGSPWIWNQVEAIFPTAKQVLDYYHCSQHVHELARLQYGEGTRAAQQWIEATLTRLYNGEIDNVIAGFQRMRARTLEAEAKIKTLSNYLAKNTARIDYGAAKRGGYHIGSGAIESANKFIGHVRLKRSGAWWYSSNANNILKLRCAKYNGTYDRVIENYKRKEQERIRGNAVA